MSVLEEGRQVIEEEAKGLLSLANQMPANFEKAIDAIYKSVGTLIVCGIGKSGHIGRKISSTFSSTGQKSFFLHPSEAPHGDLGMIAADDVILLISYSGESSELMPVVEFAKRMNITTLSISRNASSRLAKNTDIFLELPHAAEACSSIGCIPTVSSTMTLALGDAMAVSLLSRKGFSLIDFKKLHPGGSIGQSLLFAQDLMHKGTELPLVFKDILMAEAIITMSAKSLGCLGIVDEQNKLTGIITDGDLRRHMIPELLSLKVSQVMTKNPISIKKETMLGEALKIMETNQITCLFVLNEKQEPIGCLHIHDLLRRKLV